MTKQFDIAVVGAGMAGASIAAMTEGRAAVVLLEAEDQPGYHTTGRSAASWSETYGGPGVQPLTSASGPWLMNPPDGYGPESYLSDWAKLEIATPETEHLIDALFAEFEGSGVDLKRVDGERLREMVPMLRERWTSAALLESCKDIDVARLHQDYLAAARRHGAELITGAEVEAMRREAGRWQISIRRSETIEAGIVVNAAGAWADGLAQMAGIAPVGITPLRRTMVQVELKQPVDPDLPFVKAVDGSFYFREEAGGRLWICPHDEIPSVPCDAQPEEMDIAIAVDRLEQATRYEVRRVERSWAGLRSFAPDRLPVFGYEPGRRDFFWFAGQGGFGIQTAPAAAMVGAALLLGTPLPDAVAGIDLAPYAPSRFR